MFHHRMFDHGAFHHGVFDRRAFHHDGCQ